MKRAEFWSGAISGLAARADLLVFLAGLALFSVGLSLAWLPLGLIGAGVVLMAVSLFGGGHKE